MSPLTKSQRIQALAVLGLPGTAALPEITAAYRDLVRATHPDLTGDAGPATTARLTAIVDAYRVLDNNPAPASARMRPSAQIYSRSPANVKIEPPIVAGPTTVVPTLFTRSHQRGVL